MAATFSLNVTASNKVFYNGPAEYLRPNAKPAGSEDIRTVPMKWTFHLSHLPTFPSAKLLQRSELMNRSMSATHMKKLKKETERYCRHL